MATGDQADIVSRIRAVLPAAWFPTPAASGVSSTPILDALLNGAAACGAWLYSLLQGVVAAARIGTATGVFLDGVAADFFGTALQRNPGEGDVALRARIKAALLLPLGTRAGIIEALQMLTGRTPRLVEPWNTGDTSAYNQNTFAYAGVSPTALIDYRPSGATYLDGTGILQSVGPNVLRPLFVGGVQTGNLIEGAATNYVANPRMEGVVVGTPGALPTEWGGSLAPGLSWAVVSTGTFNNIPFFDIQVTGTVGGSGTQLALLVYLDLPAIPMPNAATYTLSAWAQVIAGATPNGQVELHFEEESGGPLFPGVVISSPTTWTRYSLTDTMNYPTDTTFSGEIWVYCVAGDVVNFTLRIGSPQIEQGTAATSLILPPAGSPGTSTRAADTVWSAGDGSGCYGSLLLPAQVFVTAFRPSGSGIAQVAGYYGTGNHTGPGGYGVGAIEYGSEAMVEGHVTDTAIFSTINSSRPAGTTAWVAISN